MSYLISQDYLMQIQPQLRAQINSLAMSRAELTAQEEINGYLSSKYLTSAEFTDTSLYNISVIYQAYNRVYINYPAYVSTNSYVAGNYITNGNNAYVCTGATTGTFDPTKWTFIGSATTLYFASYPYPIFDLYKNYRVGDKVYWNGNTYTCLQATTYPSGVQQLQYYQYDSIPPNNIFPDDPVNGTKYWTNNGAYSVPVNSLNSASYNATSAYSLGNTVTWTDNNVYKNISAIPSGGEAWNPLHWLQIWTLGDNRSQLMVTHMINIALYWAHYSISPNNVPDDRRDAYGIAKEWCKSVRDSKNSTPLAVIQPKKGQKIMFDSQVKRGNSY